MKEYGIAVKINLYTGSWVEEVVYYRYNLPLHIVQRWLWYFEYLAARLKVRYPHRKVELIVCQQNTLSGTDYISEKTKNLLRAKKVKLKKLRTGDYQDDLFGFTSSEKSAQEEIVMREIEALERGEVNFYVPPTRINKIKQHLL